MTLLSCSTNHYQYSYVPAAIVEFLHGIPHLKQDLTLSTSTFNATFSVNNDYALGVVGIPSVLVSLGIISLVIFQICLLFRCCCECMKCGPSKFQKTKEKKSNWKKQLVDRRQFLLKLFYIFLFIILVVDQLLLYGNYQLNSGVSTVDSTLSTLSGTFKDLSDAGVSLQSQADNVVSDILNLSTCTNHVAVNDNLTLTSYVILEKFVDGVNPYPYAFDVVEKYLTEYATVKKDVVLYIFYVIILLLSLLFMVSPLCELKSLLRGCIIICELVIVALTVSCCVEMVVVTVLADFCMDPVGNFLMILQTHNSDDMNMYNALSYYQTCSDVSNGVVNPLSSPLQEASDVLLNTRDTLQSYTTNASHPCYDDVHVANAISSISSINSQANLLNCMLSCDLIAPDWFDAINISFCTEMFTGFAVLWVEKFVTSVFLFALICVASVLYQFFGVWWDFQDYCVDPTESDEEEDEEEGDYESGEEGEDEEVESGEDEDREGDSTVVKSRKHSKKKKKMRRRKKRKQKKEEEEATSGKEAKATHCCLRFGQTLLCLVSCGVCGAASAKVTPSAGSGTSGDEKKEEDDGDGTILALSCAGDENRVEDFGAHDVENNNGWDEDSCVSSVSSHSMASMQAPPSLSYGYMLMNKQNNERLFYAAMQKKFDETREEEMQQKYESSTLNIPTRYEVEHAGDGGDGEEGRGVVQRQGRGKREVEKVQEEEMEEGGDGMEIHCMEDID